MALRDSYGNRLLVWHDLADGTKQDLTDKVHIGGGKGNPFGWSAYELMWEHQRIGSVYCGSPKDMEPNFHARWESDKPEE